MAETLVGLVRGINVGKAKRVSMGDLRELLEEIGYTGVHTLLNSGNVVFDAPGASATVAARRIEEGVRERLGIDARVIVLAGGDLETIISDNPLFGTADNHSRLMVTVLDDPADRQRLVPLTQEDWTPEALALGGRVAYTWCPAGVSQSRLTEELGRALGRGAVVTTRNWATMLRIQRAVKERS